MEQLTRLVELFAVRRIEGLANHGHAVLADHLGEHVLERGAHRLEFSGVQRAEGGVGGVADPLRAVLEQAAIHRPVRADHGRQPEAGLIEKLLHGAIPRRDGGDRRPKPGGVLNGRGHARSDQLAGLSDPLRAFAQRHLHKQKGFDCNASARRDRQRPDLKQAVGHVHSNRRRIRHHQGHARSGSFVQQHVPFLPQPDRRQSQAQRHGFLAGQVRALQPHLAAEHAFGLERADPLGHPHPARPPNGLDGGDAIHHHPAGVRAMAQGCKGKVSQHHFERAGAKSFIRHEVERPVLPGALLGILGVEQHPGEGRAQVRPVRLQRASARARCAG